MLGAYIPRLVDRSYGCRDCLAQSCAQATACAGSTTCLGSVSCNENCSFFDISCQDKCAQIDPVPDGGVSGAQALYASITNTCKAECAFGAQWGCVGKVSWPVPAVGVGTVKFTVEVFDSGTHQLLQGLTVKGCGRNDATCVNPIDTQTTDSNGLVRLTAPVVQNLGWDGFLEVSGTAAGADYGTTLSFPVIAITGDVLEPYVQLAVTTPDLLDNIAVANGFTRDTSRGIVIAFARDCELVDAPHVTFAVNPEAMDAETVPYYAVNGVPSKYATETQFAATGAWGGWINLKPGSVNVTAKSLTIGQEYSSTTIFVRANAVTVTRALPTPNP
jgi:hypothetical protein